MADELSVLQELGLSSNEAKIYLLLVKGGQMRAAELAVKSGLQRRTIYDTLQMLEKKGMAGKADVGGVQAFSPSPPSSLLSFVDEKRDAIEKILPYLSKSFEQEEKTNVSVIHGTSGMKMILEDILHLKVDYCVYYGQLQVFDYLPKFFPIFNEKRKKLGLHARYILLDTTQARERSKLVPNAKFKFIDPSAISMGVWWVYADRLVLFVLQKVPIMVYIKNAALVKTFQRTFDHEFDSNVGVYRGFEGIKAILEQTLQGSETLFIGGSGKVPELLPEYAKNSYDPRAIKSGHVWYNIAYRSILKTAAMKQPFHKIRFLPKGWEQNPNVVWIYGNHVANVVWLKEPVAFVLEDEKVAKANRNYFWLLWNLSSEK